MPIPEGTPDRLLVIQRSGPNGPENLQVMESAFDTVPVRANGSTYKMLGYVPIAEVKDGSVIEYVPRSKLADNPDRQDVAVQAVADATSAGVPVPSAVRRIAGVDANAAVGGDPADVDKVTNAPDTTTADSQGARKSTSGK